ncbi:glucosaminidase domain-containing protein [Paraburkholderia caribensis]|uniref:glucosaminidase domain-containing protein n=1 Tax=Paraburkholderia caribensis TaxID=75105 RepID=UPI001CB5F480|nr:glucosaminidase domain-containing protein [Paraburkholderia caribensis]CAG9256011.1 LYZ2 domain-containing protein [Paraburkholderia caribensis]
MADLSALSDDQLLGAVAPASHTPASFAAQYGGIAQAVGQKLGVDPNLVLGQLGLETGWGKSVVPGTNNLGNIKDFSGGGVAARDNQTGTTDRYRQYDNPDAFATDYANLLANKYPGVVGAGSDVQKFTSGLAGYAQDPAYAQKVAATTAAVQRANPGFLARVGNAVAGAISGTANAATPQELSGISDADLLAALASRGNAAAQTAQQPSSTPPVLDQVGHQLGLTARAVGHGVADAVGLVANPVNALINTVGGAFGHDPHLQDVDTLIRRGVDAITPAPANGTEQTVNDIAGAVANPVNLIGGPIVAGARTIPQAAVRGAIAGAVTGDLQPVHQGDTLGTLAQRGAAGAIGGAVGGAAGAAASNALDGLINGANRIVTAVRANLPSTQAAARVSADDILQRAAQDQGIDLAAIPQSILNGVRQQVTEALSSNATPDAVALLRRAEGEAVLGPNAGLTLGQVTRDPAQFTAERNMRGVQGAGEPLMQRYADQNTGLINAVNNEGAAAAPGEFNAGSRLINALDATDAASRREIDALYQNARDLNGGDIPLDGHAFASQAIAGLDQDLAHAFVPEYYRGVLNDISTGQLPLTVGVGEQLKTQLARSIRSSTDGNERHALGILRNALDNAPPVQSTAVGGNQMVTAAQAAQLPPSTMGDQALSAFNTARAAAAERFGTIDNNPALRAVVNGDAVPDNFFKRYVLNGNVGDVNSLLQLVPDQGTQLRAQVVDYLKSKALNGASDEIGNFSQSAFNKALNSLGTAKLQAIFGPEQAARLQQIGRVAGYVQAQPAGSAVNNSNTGAAVMNLLGQMSGKVGSLPGINIARNSLNQFLDERAAAAALAANVRARANPGVEGSLNALLPVLAPLGGAVAAQPGH